MTEQQLAQVIITLVRELARTTPPPRGAPYFYLDTDAWYDLRALDPLCTRGIFRKYEFALDIGSGLGGRARWLAARSGCRVLGIDPQPATVAAAAVLNRRCRMEDQVTFEAAQLSQLPVRDRVFTHVWMVDAMWDVGEMDVLAEAFRVLRRGGHFGLQCPIPLLDRRNALIEGLRRVGFVEVETSAVTAVELPHTCRMARERLAALRPAVPQAYTGLDGRRAQTAPPAHSRLQVFARRPG